MKKILALMVSIVLCVSLFAFASAESGDTFKVGLSTTFSGQNAQYGLDAIAGAELAIEMINANGGFNGTPVELVYYDEQGAAEEAVKIAQKLIQTDNVTCVIGSNSSSNAIAAAPYYNDAGVIDFIMGNTSTMADGNWDYVYRATMNTAYAMPVIEDVVDEMGFKTVSILKSQDDNALSSAADFSAECAEDGIEILAEESFAMTDTDFTGQCAKVISSNPECVFMSISGEAAGLLVKQLRGMGYTGIIFSKEVFVQTCQDIAGAANSDYIICATPYLTYADPADCTIPNMSEFLDLFIAKKGSCPVTEIAYRSWDTMLVLWEASKIAGSNDTEALKAAIDQVKDLEGLGGILDYTTGDHEGYHSFNSFVLLGSHFQLYSDWAANGGYDAYKAATGNEK